MFGFFKKNNKNVPLRENETPDTKAPKNLESIVYETQKKKICAICGKEDSDCFDVYAGGDDLILACPKCRAEIIAQRERKQQFDQLRRKKTKELIGQLAYVLRLICQQKQDSTDQEFSQMSIFDQNAEEKEPWDKTFSRIYGMTRHSEKSCDEEGDNEADKNKIDMNTSLFNSLYGQSALERAKNEALRIENENRMKERDWLEGAIRVLHMRLDKLSEEFDCLAQESDFTKEPEFYDLLYQSSSFYKADLSEIKKEERELIKKREAIISTYPLDISGWEDYCKNILKGAEKQAIKLFDLQCDHIISSMKIQSFRESSRRIDEAASKISEWNAYLFLAFSSAYIECKHKELSLSYRYQLKIEEEKEEARANREAAREARKVARELAEERRRIEKEQHHYENAKQMLDVQLAVEKDEARRKVLLEKREEILDNLDKLEDSMKEVDYRSANERAGYVYVISNIGAFGENIFKIGMTRRLNPYDRIDELGGASVPFRFDVHAMIFTADAPALEHALHTAFADRRVNMVNNRKEFFHCTLEEIEAVVRENYDQAASFNPVAEAIQYRATMQMLHREN